jgi:protein TonB
MFVGGAVEFKDFITANLRYPNIAKENEITGKVIASFYIGPNGYIEMPKIIKGLGYGCDDEALRIIKLMPRWVPGRKQSEVRQLYYMTFNFGPKK